MYRILVFGLLDGPNGVSTSVMNLYRNMDRSRIQWDFVLFKESYDSKEKKERPGSFAEEIRRLGGRVHYLNYSIYAYPRYTRKKLRELMLSDPEIMGVHVHDIALNTYPLFLAKELDRPVRIIQYHSSCAKSELEAVIRKISRAKRAKLRLVSGDSFDRWACSDISGMMAYPGQSFEIFPNAVDIQKFSFHPVYRRLLRDQLGIPYDAVVFGFLASIYHIKNPLFAIDVFERYRRKYGNAHMVMVGGGDMLEEVQAHVKKRRLKRCVHVVGQQIQADLFYSVFDLFLCPSKTEGLPNTLVEAQCAGCSCLVSDEVTEMARLTELVEFCSLNEPAETWAKKARDMLQRAGERRSRDKELREAGYDVRDTADRLVRHYLARIREWEGRHGNAN